MTDGPRSGSYGDYLYALAVRVLHEDLVLQPRRASLFETETGGTDIENEAMHFGIAAALSGEEPVSRALESRAPAYGVDQSATAPQRQHTMDANERTNVPVTGQLLEGAARPAFSPGDEVIGRGTPGERNLPAMERGLRTEAGYRPTAAPVGGLLTPHAALEERWQQRDATANVPSPVLGVAPPSGPSPVIHLHEKTVRAEAATPVRLATASLHQAVMMARMVPETRNLAPLFPQAVRVPQEETTVEITIGRLDIRANSAPPAAPAKSAPKPSEPSLKEYLARQSGARS